MVEIAILGSLAYVTKHPELIALLPVIEAVRNAWKHRK